MKIAIYIAGHIRTWCDLTKKTLLNFMNGYDVDIFISTHDTLDRQENVDLDIYKKEKYTASHDEIKKLFEGLPVKDILIDTDDVEPPIEVDNFRRIAWKMWRKVYECNEMRKKYEKEHNISYTYCVRYRPDTVIMQKVEFEKLPPLETNIIGGFGPTLGWPDDLFAIGSPKVMDHYCNLEKALIPGCGPHKIAGVTFDVYPIHSFIQTAFIRRTTNHDDYHPRRQIVDFNGKFLTYFIKEEYGHYDYHVIS